MSVISQSEILKPQAKYCRISLAILPWALASASALVALNYASTEYTETVIGTRDFSIVSSIQSYPKGTQNGSPVGDPDVTITLKTQDGRTLIANLPQNTNCSFSLNNEMGNKIRITEKRIDLKRLFSSQSIIIRADTQHISNLLCTSSLIVKS